MKKEWTYEESMLLMELEDAHECIAELERENTEALQMLANKAATIKEQIEGMHARDELIRDMARELRGLNDGGIPTDCMEHEQRMRELGIEVM